VDNDTAPALVARGIRKRFGDVEVLKGVDLVLEDGRTACILGPSGSGKSTFLRCLNYLERPDDGEVLIQGKPIGTEPGANGSRVPQPARRLAQMRTQVSMVFQHFNLWPHRTVLGNVIEAPIHVQRRSRDEVVPHALELLDRVGLKHLADRYPGRLSGGQMQRVAIARALATQPKVVLFDEPTSSLDPELVGEVVSVMRDLASNRQTMVVVTHEMGFAREAADQILFLSEGVVCESGPPEQFFGNPATERARQFLRRMYAAPVGVRT
jgi:polar amino acid transport system ATP-binding protein